MADITIRLAEDYDFDAIYAIWQEGIHSSSNINMEEMRAKFHENFALRNGIYNYWVAANIDGEILGWQSLIKFSNNPLRENLHAESSTYIAKNARALGLGYLLVEHVIKEAEKTKLECIFAFIAKTNQAAAKIGKDLGFLEVGQLPSLKENSIPKIFIAKSINQMSVKKALPDNNVVESI